MSGCRSRRSRSTLLPPPTHSPNSGAVRSSASGTPPRSGVEVGRGAWPSIGHKANRGGNTCPVGVTTVKLGMRIIARLRFHSRPSCRVIGCCTIAVYRDPRPVTRWSRSVLTISERRAALGNDTPVPKKMNGAVSRARLGINRRPPFGYYFARVWGTIAPKARPGKPQFSSGWIFSGSSNPSPSSGESGANLTFRCVSHR